MSEIEDRLAVYGAIDRAVLADPDLIETVAPFLGAYEQGAAAGWFDEFEAWTLERTGAETSPFPGLEDALRNLADREPVGRAAARRLLALAVAARVFPDLRDPSAPGSIQAALTVDGLAGFGNDDRAAALLALLIDDDQFARMADWPRMIETAFDAGLIPAFLAMQGVAPPCGGTLVVIDSASGQPPAAAINTSFWTDQITLQQAMRFLDPVNWPTCCSLWCSMTPIGTSAAGNPEYREVVSLDCSNMANTWTAEAELEFAFRAMPGEGRVVYDLCDGRPQPGDLVVEDSGTLAIREEGNGIRVITTKRVRFDHPFSGQSLGMLTCALGYGSAVEDMLFTCALGSNESDGTPFPETSTGTGQGGTVTRPKRRPDHRRPPLYASTAPDPEAGKAMQDAVDDAVSAAKQCVEDCVEAYTASYEKISAGTYKADDLMTDMAKMWARLLRDAALVADVGLRATRAGAAASKAAAASATAPSREPASAHEAGR